MSASLLEEGKKIYYFCEQIYDQIPEETKISIKQNAKTVLTIVAKNVLRKFG